MHRPDADQRASRPRRSFSPWPAFATVVLVLTACSPGPGGASLTASQGGNPSPTSGAVRGSASESEAASPSSAESGTLTGTWDGSWAIDPPYAASAGNFTMELVQTGSSFSGTVEITNSECRPTGTVNGNVDGTSISFGWVLTEQPIQFTGTLAGTSMSGTWSANACSDSTISLTGTWEATKG